ncbi:MAG: DJ-1/PfpI family protein [Candidatus Hadarchaeales archaeon]
MDSKGSKIPVISIAVVLVFLAIAGTYLLIGGRESVSISGKNVLIVLAPAGFNDTEYSTVRNLLAQSGASVHVASTTTQTAIGMQGTQVNPDMSVADASATDYDAVVLIGGAGVENAYFNSQVLHTLLISANDHGKVIGAICIAPVVLANAGILNGKRATVFDGSYITMLEARGAIYTGESVTADGNIITANGPGASDEFARKIIEALQRL